MIGILSYGGYIPRNRLGRMAIAANMAWYNPVIFAAAKGEKSVANWDEDAVSMSVAAAQDCLKGADAKGLDGVYLASTTLPFADRQNAGIVAAALNAPEAGLSAVDFASSTRAGITAAISAAEAIKSGNKKKILVTAADQRRTKMATMFEMFLGDGAAALLLGEGDVIAEYLGSYSHSCDFVDHYRGIDKKYDYSWEERWVRDEGYAKIIPQAIKGFFEKTGMSPSDITMFVYPCYYNREHSNVAKKMGVESDRVRNNLQDVCGDTGTAHPVLMLAAALEDAKPGDVILAAGFGQGCDVICFKTTDRIRNFKGPRGVKGALANRVEFNMYQKYIKFRDLIEADLGIRGEANPNTSLTTLWRNRKMILGFMGGKCTKCGTVQYPAQTRCVNPACNAMSTLEDYAFSDKNGKVLMYTGDMLSASVDPPAVYGLVNFDGGGRAFVDFTDCNLEEVKVGMPIRMSFRRRYVDKARGFTGYFWKAVPQTGR